MQSVYWKLSSSRVVKGSRLASCACTGMRLCSCNVYTHARWLQPPVSKQCSHVCRLYMIN